MMCLYDKQLRGIQSLRCDRECLAGSLAVDWMGEVGSPEQVSLYFGLVSLTYTCCPGKGSVESRWLCANPLWLVLAGSYMPVVLAVLTVNCDL